MRSCDAPPLRSAMKPTPHASYSRLGSNNPPGGGSAPPGASWVMFALACNVIGPCLPACQCLQWAPRTSAHLGPPAEASAQPSPAPLRSRPLDGPPLAGKHPPAHPSAAPFVSADGAGAQVPGGAYPRAGRSPRLTRPLHNAGAADLSRCAAIRVASRALKDSIADLIAAGKIEFAAQHAPAQTIFARIARGGCG